MKKLFLTILIMIATIAQPIAMAATPVSASTLLKRTADNLKSAPSIMAKFTLSQQQEVSKGCLTIAGDKFKISLGDGELTTWYDGENQWVYNPHTDEMNVSSPTPDELATVNPFVIIATFRNAYKARTLKSTAVSHVIELLPIDKQADIRKAIITIDSRYFPTAATLTMSNGHTINIKIASISKGGKLAATVFRPDKKKYHSAEWIDFR